MAQHTNTAPQRVVLYSHDSVGLGHVRRNLAISHAIAQASADGTLPPTTGLIITGEAGAGLFERPDTFDLLVLPGISKSQGRYAPRCLSISHRRLMELRKSVIHQALQSFSPHLIIVDRHAFGVDGELRESLRALRYRSSWNGQPVRIVLGLRDVLDDPAHTRREWTPSITRDIAALFDEIWVYGDEQVHDVVASGELPSELGPMVRYLGLIGHGRPSRRRLQDSPYWLTMVGGGSDGRDLACAAAAVRVPEGMRHLVVAGPQMTDGDRKAVRAAAAERCTVMRSVPDGQALIREAEAVISMGGYNTVCEILASETPALIVPRCEPRLEQQIRAEALERVGAVSALPPSELSPENLQAWLAESASLRVSMTDARQHLSLDGLSSVVDQIRSESCDYFLEERNYV